MYVINAVFRALVAIGPRASRREIEDVADLDKDAVHAGLRGLARRDVLVVANAGQGRPALYSLAPGAPAPEDLRGRWPHDAAWRTRQREGIAVYHAGRQRGQDDS